MKRKRRRKKKKSIFNKLFLGFFSFIVFVVILFSALYKFSPNLKIKGFEIIGAETVSSEEVKKEAQTLFISSFNFLGQEITIDNILFSFKKGEELLKMFPEIESISVKKDFSKSIIYLEIKEKEPAIIWCNYEKCSLFNKEASFIRDCEKSNDWPIIKEEDKNDYIKEEAISAVLKIEKILKEYNLKPEQYLLYSEKIIADNVNNCDIIFNLDNDFDWQLEKMETVLKQEKYLSQLSTFSYIDLRFGNQAIVK